jgi:hypothetical protein
MSTQNSHECWMCGTTNGLRLVSDGDGWVPPQCSCEDCFTAQQIGGDGHGGKCCGVMDGPDFDDLEPVEAAA